MNKQTLIYIAAAGAAVIIAVTIAHLWSEHRLRNLEQQIDAQRFEAAEQQSNGAEAEKAAEAFKQKIEYLESQLADVRSAAVKEDEELEKLNADTNDARDNVRRARLRTNPCRQPARE